MCNVKKRGKGGWWGRVQEGGWDSGALRGESWDDNGGGEGEGNGIGGRKGGGRIGEGVENRIGVEQSEVVGTVEGSGEDAGRTGEGVGMDGRSGAQGKGAGGGGVEGGGRVGDGGVEKGGE